MHMRPWAVCLLTASSAGRHCDDQMTRMKVMGAYSMLLQPFRSSEVGSTPCAGPLQTGPQREPWGVPSGSTPPLPDSPHAGGTAPPSRPAPPCSPLTLNIEPQTAWACEVADCNAGDRPEQGEGRCPVGTGQAAHKCLLFAAGMLTAACSILAAVRPTLDQNLMAKEMVSMV